MISLAKITSKGQTTIPLAVREALRIAPGDTIAWEVSRDGFANVRRVEAVDLNYLCALEKTLTEWSGEEDEAAYRDL